MSKIGIMKQRWALSFGNMIFLISFALLLLVLVWRFRIVESRFFDVDELHHMHNASMIAQGQLPYRDFGYFYSPVFAFTFVPLFWLMKESAGVLFLGRGLVFFMTLASGFLGYLIGSLLSGRKGGLITALLIFSLPVILDKTIEIRPDNLAILFWLLATYWFFRFEKDKNRLSIFLSGLFLGVSGAVLLKAGFAYPGFLVALLFLWFRKKIGFDRLAIFHFGGLLPFGIMFLFFGVRGILGQAVYQIFRMPIEANWSYGREYFVPLFVFKPNDAFYGTGDYGLTWMVSNLVLAFGLVWLLVRRNIFFITSVVFFCFSLLFFYKVTLLQYYLFLFYALIIGAGWGLSRFCDCLDSISKKLSGLFFIFIFALIIFSFQKTAYIHFGWLNGWQIERVNEITAVSRPGDHVFDMTGYHIFRPSGYYICCDFFSDFRKNLSCPIPEFQDYMRANQTRFVLMNDRLTRLGPKDRDFLKENYFPTEISDIYVVGQKIAAGRNQSTGFSILADGWYRLLGEGAANAMIDGYPGGEVFLKAGEHSLFSPAKSEFTLIYDYDRMRTVR